MWTKWRALNIFWMYCTQVQTYCSCVGKQGSEMPLATSNYMRPVLEVVNSEEGRAPRGKALILMSLRVTQELFLLWTDPTRGNSPQQQLPETFRHANPSTTTSSEFQTHKYIIQVVWCLSWKKKEKTPVHPWLGWDDLMALFSQWQQVQSPVGWDVCWTAAFCCWQTRHFTVSVIRFTLSVISFFSVSSNSEDTKKLSMFRVKVRVRHTGKKKKKHWKLDVKRSYFRKYLQEQLYPYSHETLPKHLKQTPDLLSL